MTTGISALACEEAPNWEKPSLYRYTMDPHQIVIAK